MDRTKILKLESENSTLSRQMFQLKESTATESFLRGSETIRQNKLLSEVSEECKVFAP